MVSSTTDSNTRSFPHPTLTTIIGKPTYASLRQLQKELYANAKTVPSTLGGGQHGHLAIVMPPADYLALAAVPYDVPIHPGPQPAHPAGATAAQITEANRLYDQTLTLVALHVSITNALRQQLLVAVDNKYILELEDPDLGYTVSPQAILAYLKTHYGALTPNEIELNRGTLAAAWNPDDDIEDLWLRLRDAQTLAIRAGEPITDAAAIRLTVLALETTGVFDFALDNWRLKPDATKTLASFKEHFNKENEERVRKLTAKTGGFHGVHSVEPVPVPNAAILVTPPPSPHVVLPSGTKMYYCWSHGLSKKAAHTSATCSNRKDGHIETATADNLQGGNYTISGRRRPSAARPPTTP